MEALTRYVQHEYVKIHNFTTSRWEHPVHNHTYFEIIFIHKGAGIHTLCGKDYSYTGKDMFFLAPSDFHSFTITQETEFTFIKFNNVYLNGIGNIQLEHKWNQCMDELLFRAAHRMPPVLKSLKEAKRACNIIRLLIEEWSDAPDESNETLFFLVQALLSIIKRNTMLQESGSNIKYDEKTNAIIDYINSNIYSAEKTQAQHLASVFNLSVNYLGMYFKEHTGTTLRSYISRHKLNMIENRLRFSSFSIKEIANEFEFTDLSHFNKFFKTHKGINPSEYRERTAVLVTAT